MIGSWYAQGSTWAWEVVTADSTVIATGVADDEATARWECRMAIFVAGTADGPADTAVAQPPALVSLGGRRSARASARA
jgi:hypothetical protein